MELVLLLLAGFLSLAKGQSEWMSAVTPYARHFHSAIICRTKMTNLLHDINSSSTNPLSSLQPRPPPF